MRVLVTGAEGFVGGHLRTCLEAHGHEVIATSASGEPGHRLVLPDADTARTIIRDGKPDTLVHLAGVAYVPEANHDPERTFRVNVEGTTELFRALHEERPGSRFFLVSSAAVYGSVPEDRQPIDEQEGVHPTDVYSWSKLAAESALHTLAGALEAPLVVLRPFNHTGPGQAPGYVLPSFARQIAAIERAAGSPVVKVGDLSVRRDILDVRDVAEAYVRLLESADVSGIYNVAAGSSRPLSEHLDALCALSSRTIEVQVDPDLLRPNDIPLMEGDATRLRRATGWEPRIAMEQTLSDLLESWRVQHNPSLDHS